MSNVLRVPFVPQQSDGYCLPACVCIVLGVLGIDAPQEQIAQRLGTSEYGTPFSCIQRLATTELKVQFASEGSLETIEAALQSGLPVIAAVHSAWLPYADFASQHAVVITGLAESVVTLLDPATEAGLHEIATNAFIAAWTEMDCTYAIISKAA